MIALSIDNSGSTCG